MHGETRLEQAVKILAVLLGLAYVLTGIIGGAFIDFDSSSDRGFWLGFLIGGGVLLLLAVGVLAIVFMPAVAKKREEVFQED